MTMLGKLFPESIFPRKLTPELEQRVRLAQARAEETLVRAHVENALSFVDTLAPEVGYERALDIYIRELGVPEPLSSIVVTRALVQLGETLVPPPRDLPDGETARDSEEPVPLPALVLDASSEARRRRA